MTVTPFAKAIFAIAAIASAASVLASDPADARGRGREHFIQDYHFKKPHDGFEGRTFGGAYCSYHRLPKRVCTSNGCKIVGWTLRQMCG